MDPSPLLGLFRPSALEDFHAAAAAFRRGAPHKEPLQRLDKAFLGRKLLLVRPPPDGPPPSTEAVAVSEALISTCNDNANKEEAPAIAAWLLQSRLLPRGDTLEDTFVRALDWALVRVEAYIDKKKLELIPALVRVTTANDMDDALRACAAPPLLALLCIAPWSLEGERAGAEAVVLRLEMSLAGRVAAILSPQADPAGVCGVALALASLALAQREAEARGGAAAGGGGAAQ